MTVATKEDIEFLWKWRKYLLLLATQVASFTYVAGLNPPGVDQPVPSVVSTDSIRYAVFFYCNDAAFVASLVVIIFLLDRRIIGNVVGLTVLRLATLLDLLALMAAFAAGSCRDVFATIYVSALFAIVFAYYVAVHVSVARLASRQEAADSCAEPRAEESHLKERRKFLLLLASFATPLTYAAGLAPPGGFWSQTKGGHRAGAPLLHDGRYKIRYHAFFYANASSFVASLASIMLLMSSSLSGRLARSHALPVCALVELLGLMAAFVAGSTRSIPTTVYITSLVGTVVLYIMLMYTFKQWSGAVRRLLTCILFLPDAEVKQVTAPETGNAIANVPIEENEDGAATPTRIHINNGDAADKAEEESRSLLLLLGTLVATVTYQAGLSPPGGVWPEGIRSHIPGLPVLLDKQFKRYEAFYHCNTAAFVASLIVIVIVQSKELSSGTAVRRALNTVMLLGLFALMGAYVAGSCRDTTTTIYVSSLAIAVVVYSIAKVVAYTASGKSELIKWVLGVCKKLAPAMRRLPPALDDEHHKVLLERRHKFLLELAILAATLTYQARLNPPGGFSPEDKEGITAGDPVLLDYNWIRYQVFFYCNATGFMVSLAVIQLLVNRTPYTPGIRSKVLHVCVLVELLGFLGAYAAGNGRKLRASIYFFSVLVAPVVTFVILQILLFVHADRTPCSWLERPWLQCVKGLLIPLSIAPLLAKRKEVPAEQSKKYLRHKDVLMLLGMLGASVTYQAGLAPPGGTASGDDDAVSSPSPSSLEAGNPILLYTNPTRYQAFFYCNATSFVASVVVIILLLQRTMKQRGAPLWAMQTAVVLDQLGLLGAYAAGSSLDRETSTYVIIAVAAVGVLLITLYVLLSSNTVVHKARKLKAWMHCGGANEDLVGRNGDNV